MTDHTRRIVESPLFETVGGITLKYRGSPGVINRVNHDGTFDAFIVHPTYTTNSLCLDWADPLVEFHPDLGANPAILIYMLSKHCAWAKLHKTYIEIGHGTWVDDYCEERYLTECINAPTLAETFAQAFAYVEGLQ